MYTGPATQIIPVQKPVRTLPVKSSNVDLPNAIMSHPIEKGMQAVIRVIRRPIELARGAAMKQFSVIRRQR